MAETSPFFPSAPAQDKEAEDGDQSPGQRQRPVAKRRLAREGKAAAACGICLEAVEDQGFLLRRVSSGLLVPACSHAYCFACVMTWAERTNTCPMCKERFTAIRHKCGDKSKTGGGVGPRPVRAGEVVEVEHRDAAANCSSDDEDAAVALAEDGDNSNSNSELSGDESGRGLEAWEHGYMVDGFLVRDESEDEGESDEEAQAQLDLECFSNMFSESSPDASPLRSTRRYPMGTTGNSGGGSSYGGSGSSSRAAGSLRRGNRVPGGRGRAGGGIVSSPGLGLLAGDGARGRRGTVRHAVMAAASAGSEMRQGRGKGDGGGGGDGAASASSDDSDHDEERLLPNELRQLQREAARLVGNSPLRPRRRPPPPSRLSRYPRRNAASRNNSSSMRSGLATAARYRSSVDDDDGGGGGGDVEGDRRRQQGWNMRGSSGAFGASNDAFSSRRGRLQRRQQQRRQQQQSGGESDGWCATSSDSSEEEEEEEEEKEEKDHSEIETDAGASGSAEPVSGNRYGESARQDTAGATAAGKGVDDSDSDMMADDIWMEQVPSPLAFAQRPRRAAVGLRQGGGGGRHEAGNGCDARSNGDEETDNQESEEEEAEFDWRIEQPFSSTAHDKHDSKLGAEKQDNKLEEEEEEEEKEAELELDWRVRGSSSSPHQQTAAATRGRRGTEGSARGIGDGTDVGGAEGRTGRRGWRVRDEVQQQAPEPGGPSSSCRLPWRTRNDGGAPSNKENGAPPKHENDDICRKRRRRDDGGGGGGGGNRAVFLPSSLSLSSPLFEQFRYTGGPG
eukprot:g12716.t1